MGRSGSALTGKSGGLELGDERVSFSQMESVSESVVKDCDSSSGLKTCRKSIAAWIERWAGRRYAIAQGRIALGAQS